MASRRKPPLNTQTSLDEQFDAFLKASIGSDSDTSLSKYIKPKQRKEKPWWQSSMDSSEEYDNGSNTGLGLGASGKSFIKKPKTIIPPIAPKSPDKDSKEIKFEEAAAYDSSVAEHPEPAPRTPFLKEVTSGAFSVQESATEPTEKASRRLTTDEFRESQLSYDQSTETGQETLEENADKSRFFKNLEADATSTLDYSKLNRQLEDTRATNRDLDPHDEETETEQTQEVEEHESAFGALEPTRRSNLLANVSLNTTLDTSLLATSGPTADQSAGGMGNTSQLDYEAVHQAYKDVHDKSGTVKSLPFVTRESHQTHKTSTEGKGQSEGNEDGEDDEQRPDAESYQKDQNDEEEEEHEDSHVSHHSTPKKRSPSSSSSSSVRKFPVQPPSQSVWDLEPVASADLEELKPINTEVHEKKTPDSSPVKTPAAFTTPLASVPAAGQSYQTYQTVDELSPVLQEKSMSTQPYKYEEHHHSVTSSSEKGKPMLKTQTLQRPLSASRRSKSTDKFAHVKSSGYGVVNKTARQRSASPKAKSAKKKNGSSPGTAAREGSILLEKTHQDKDAVTQVETSPVKLIQSVESFANYLKEQFISSTPAAKMAIPNFSFTEKSTITSDRDAALLAEVREWQQKWRDECRLKEKLTADFMSAQRDWERYSEESRLKYEQEVSKLRQQIFILEAKVNVKTTVGGDDAESDPVVTKNIARLEAEIKTQENLIAGYQQENERLYKDMKQVDTLHKQMYEKLYQENHKMASENAQMREQLAIQLMDQRQRVLNPGQYGTVIPNTHIAPDMASQSIVAGQTYKTPAAYTEEPITAALGAGRIAELKAQLTKAKNDVAEFAAQVSRLSHEKVDLTTKLEYMTRERDNLKELLLISKQPAEFKVIQDRYHQEITTLENKVKWYVENQRLLDSDVEKLRQKDREISELKNQIKRVEDQKGKYTDSAQRAKDRSADTKRIKDLERQVKELEQIMRRRNPNSIPSLMWAASIMPDQSESNKSPSMKFLEERVAKLENELSEKDGETTRLLRAMEQECNQAKAVYIQRISDMENELMKIGKPSTGGRHSTVSALEKDLEAAREQHKKRQKEQQDVIDELREEVSKLKKRENAQLKAETRVLRQSREMEELKSHDLQLKLDEKLDEISGLHDMIERLQNEKRQLLVELNHIQSVKGAIPERASIPTKSLPEQTDSRKTRVISSSPSKRRDYVPNDFTAEHINDVLEMNKTLAIKYEKSQLELSELRVNHQKQMAELEAQMRIERETLQSKLEEQRIQNKADRDRLVAQQALKQTEAEVTKYKNQIDTLETVIKHLKEDRRQWLVDSEELSALRIRNITLDNRIKALEDHLEDAKENHTPEMRHFERLKDKISHMEQRFTTREDELKKIISQNQITYREDLRLEVQKWKNIVNSKNKDIEKFRYELDSILTVLKELRKQGVVIPLGSC